MTSIDLYQQCCLGDAWGRRSCRLPLRGLVKHVGTNDQKVASCRQHAVLQGYVLKGRQWISKRKLLIRIRNKDRCDCKVNEICKISDIHSAPCIVFNELQRAR